MSFKNWSTKRQATATAKPGDEPKIPPKTEQTVKTASEAPPVTKS